MVFTVDDDEQDDDLLASPEDEHGRHSVRFNDQVQVIGPSLKSTMQSREVGAYQC